MLDIDDFPVGIRVITPTGRVGTVIKHRGAESKLDHFQRLTVRLDDAISDDFVTLQPHLLTKFGHKCGNHKNQKEIK